MLASRGTREALWRKREYLPEPRFDPDGKVLNGPAIAPLAPTEEKDAKSQCGA